MNTKDSDILINSSTAFCLLYSREVCSVRCSPCYIVHTSTAVSNPAPGEPVSCRVWLQPQFNTPKQVNQSLTRHIRNFQASVLDLNFQASLELNSAGQWPSRLEFGHPCMIG